VLRKRHKASRGLRQQLSEAKSGTTSSDGTVPYYLYSACFLHYYSAEYKYTIRPTIRTQHNTNRIFGTALLHGSNFALAFENKRPKLYQEFQ